MEVVKTAGCEFSRPKEEVIYIVGLLKKLGRANISTLDNRIVCQKIIYFASQLGLAPAYRFNLYLRGPYSPNLASDLYTLSSSFKDRLEIEFLDEENKKKFDSLENLCRELSYKPRYLEITATLHTFLTRYRLTEAIKRLKEIKPTATSEEIAKSLGALNKAGLNRRDNQ